MVSQPNRGDVWTVNLDPTVGAEIRKTRPAVVVSSDSVGVLPLKLVAPVTDWKEWYSRDSWHVRIDPDVSNGLAKVSAVDVLQLRAVDTQRFVQYIGQVSPDILRNITDAIAVVIEIE